MGDGVVNVAGAVFQLREEEVVSYIISVLLHSIPGKPTLGVHGYRPMHEVQIHIGRLQQFQALLQTLLGPGVECAPELAGDEEILPLHDAPRDDVLQRLANLIFVLVAEGAVNVSVSCLDGMNDCLFDLARRRLPRSQAQGGNDGASVERDCGVHVGLWVKDVLRSSLEHEVGERRIHGEPGELGYM